MSLLLAVCFNGNAVGCTSEVTLRWDQLVLGWMTIFGWANLLGMGMGFPWKSCCDIKTWLTKQKPSIVVMVVVVVVMVASAALMMCCGELGDCVFSSVE